MIIRQIPWLVLNFSFGFTLLFNIELTGNKFHMNNPLSCSSFFYHRNFEIMFRSDPSKL